MLRLTPIPRLRLPLKKANVRCFSASRARLQKLPEKSDKSDDTDGSPLPASQLPDDRSKTAPAEQGPRGYVPRMTYERVAYEYPPSPTVNSAGEERGGGGRIKPPAPVESSAWKRHLPYAAAAAGVLWALYAYKYFVSGEKTGEEQALEPDRFTTFKITYKEDVGRDVQLIELSPRNYEEYRKVLKAKESLWNGKHLWSVDVKQPEIQVVRKYTPLPLYYMQGGLTEKDAAERPPALMKMLGEDEDEGRFVLMVKKYDDGEVSRWLHRLPVGTLVDVRGPYVGYKFPYSPIDKDMPQRPTMQDLPSRMAPEDFPDEYAVAVPADPVVGEAAPQSPGLWSKLTGSKSSATAEKKVVITPSGKQTPLPENVAFFAGGTGVAPVLQALLSRNPPRGFVDVYYSVRTRSEIPFPRFLLFLEKAGRAKFHFFVDDENKFIVPEDVPAPAPLQYSGYTNDKLREELERQKKLDAAVAEVKKERQQLKNASEAAPVTTAPVERGAIVDTFQPPAEPASEPIPEPVSAPAPVLVRPVVENPRIKYRSILDQVTDRKATGRDARLRMQGPSLAVVCGPPGYVAYMAGRPDARGTAPIGGVLGARGWDITNTFRME